MAEDAEQPWRLPDTFKGRDVGLGGRPGNFLSPSAKARLHRIVHRAPEVMVKVTGRSRGGAGHLKAHLDYITRNGTISARTQDGTIIRDRTALRTLNDDWLLANAADERGRSSPNAAQSVSLILSMPPGTPADRLEEAALTWARNTFGTRYDWIMARHDDTDHPHVHLSVRAVGPDGRRLAPGPQELQLWRERFARELRRLGVQAEATPRQARGKVQKAAPLGLYKAEQRGAEPRVLKMAREQAAIEARASKLPQPHNWSRDIQMRQENIRCAYLLHADGLDAGGLDDQRLAGAIRRFVADMPVPLTRHQAVVVALRNVLSKHPGRTTPTEEQLHDPAVPLPCRDAKPRQTSPALDAIWPQRDGRRSSRER